MTESPPQESPQPTQHSGQPRRGTLVAGNYGAEALLQPGDRVFVFAPSKATGRVEREISHPGGIDAGPGRQGMHSLGSEAASCAEDPVGRPSGHRDLVLHPLHRDPRAVTLCRGEDRGECPTSFND